MKRVYRRRRFFVTLAALLVVVGVGIVAGLLFQTTQDQFYKSAYPTHYSDVVLRESRKNGLPPSLVYAVIYSESSFDPSAESNIGAKGLMQITDITLDWITYRLGEEKQEYEVLFDGETCIRYGTALLKLHLDEFGEVENALCAYHAGRSNALKWLADPEYAPDGKVITNIPFKDTNYYVNKVLEVQAKYQQIYDMK